MRSTTALMLPLPPPPGNIRWFSARGCVVRHEDRRDVFVGSTLVASFADGETGVRNVTLVMLAAEPTMHLGRLAEAFDVSDDTLRLLRRAYERDGIAAIWSRRRGGGEPTKATPAVRKRIFKMFDDGFTSAEVSAKLKKPKLAESTVRRLHADWVRSKRVETATETTAVEPTAPVATPAANDVDTTAHVAEAVESVVEAHGSAEEAVGARVIIDARSVSSAPLVQHVGTWLLVAMVHRLGLFERAEAVVEDRVGVAALRIALDAVVMALALGEGSVEGVRRLATPSAPELLRASRAPSATWARRTLGLFSKELGGVRLHLSMAGVYVRTAAESAEDTPVVFYVDNHMRRYTGEQVVRKGWRMQDKHVVPGTTDYYVHDEDGRPVLRIAAPHHGALTDFLSPIAEVLRMALGREQRILFAFDRAGAFPEQMATLREAGFDFVTYERRPYPTLASTEFGEPFEFDGEKLQWAEPSLKNLKKGRGRVRRIAVRHEDGRQVNLLAISEQPPEWLLGVMTGRWNQENAFKHGNERWGINQLDGRRVERYPAQTMIPNPARRRLDRALQIARTREGKARVDLARLPDGAAERERLEAEIADAQAEQRRLEEQRPSVPKRAPIEQTELRDVLVRHVDEYKVTIDTIRIACANAESELAAGLAPGLSKPAEAKKVLANLLAAPGRVRVNGTTTTVELLPAGNENELRAFAEWLPRLDDLALTLPGDRSGRTLRFRARI